ncbi:TetR/AcrR family transcriptional regulator [bacterium]|nr:TetR/AcrR family transcriptional regulator [bacterium]
MNVDIQRIMTSHNSPKQRILQAAREHFLNFGFSKVTTDELASALGMSKKTIYKHFSTKENLLREVVNWTMLEISGGLDQILNDTSLPFLQKLERILTFIGERASQFFKGTFLRDIKRNAPDIWHNFEEFRKQQIQTKFANLVGDGIRQGFFRDDVHQELVVLVYLHTVQNIINPETLANLPFTTRNVFDSIIKIIFEGILTKEARVVERKIGGQIDTERDKNIE